MGSSNTNDAALPGRHSCAQCAHAGYGHSKVEGGARGPPGGPAAGIGGRGLSAWSGVWANQRSSTGATASIGGTSST
ncbi:hypothetical protein G6F59_017363 [Rhizopus arrhizus]|nr:hypothetical protein G6F59_017363 [Rhizopus arrhizus]